MDSSLYWVDVRIGEEADNSRALFAEQFLIRDERRGSATNDPSLGGGERRVATHRIARTRVDLFCFDFDYPDLQSLELLKQTRLRYPHVPIIMLTLQHSESLAIWALRMHIWDLLLKPVSPNAIRDLAQTFKNHKTEDPPSCHLWAKPSPSCLVPEEMRLRAKQSNFSGIAAGITYIAQNLKEKISEKDVAQACGFGPYTFSRAFKKEMGITFQDYVQQQRINESMRLLMHPHASVSDVAYLVGFRDVSYFSKVFKKLVGCPPSVYREQGGSEAPISPEPVSVSCHSYT